MHVTALEIHGMPFASIRHPESLQAGIIRLQPHLLRKTQETNIMKVVTLHAISAMRKIMSRLETPIAHLLKQTLKSMLPSTLETPPETQEILDIATRRPVSEIRVHGLTQEVV